LQPHGAAAPDTESGVEPSSCWLLKVQSQVLVKAFAEAITMYAAKVPVGAHSPGYDDADKLLQPFKDLANQVASNAGSCGVDPSTCAALSQAQLDLNQAVAWALEEIMKPQPTYAFGPVMFHQQLLQLQARLDAVKDAAGC
jgi:hypothetical protein